MPQVSIATAASGALVVDDAAQALGHPRREFWTDTQWLRTLVCGTIGVFMPSIVVPRSTARVHPVCTRKGF